MEIEEIPFRNTHTQTHPLILPSLLACDRIVTFLPQERKQMEIINALQ